MREEDEQQIREFAGRNPVVLAAVLPRGGTNYYLDVYRFLLNENVHVAPFYVTKGINGDYGPISPILYSGERKLLFVDRDLETDAPLLVARRLARLKASGSEKIRYATEKPFGLHAVDDIFLDAYKSGREMKPSHLGEDARHFAKKHEAMLASKRYQKVVAERKARRFGLCLALGLSAERDAYEEVDSIKLRVGENKLFVSLDADGRPTVREGGKKMNLLLVEDDAALLRIYKAGFERYYDVTATGDPRSALQGLRTGIIPDIIVTDLRMPETNGIEIAKAAESTGTPVIIITAYPRDSIPLSDAASLRTATVVEKPVPIEKLLGIVGEKLDKCRFV